MTTILENYNVFDYSPYIGKCLCDHSQRHAWVNIPKNGSNTVSGHLLEMNWTDDNWLKNTQITEYRTVAVIRDPLKRWKGSAIELSYHYLEHNYWSFDGFEEWFRERDFYTFDVDVDLHFLRQTDFLTNLNIDNVTFIPMDTNFNQRIKDEFQIHRPIFEQNITRENQLKMKLEPYVSKLMENSILIEKIFDFYKSDYALIHDLKFENLI